MDKKINTIDLFAGCGGLMDGFEKSSFYDTLACVEWEKSPCENLEKRLKEKWNYNNADEIVMRFDIQRTEELFSGWKNDIEYGNGKGLDNLIGNKKLDIIIGGPPCQAYSVAGRARMGKDVENDPRNELYKYYVRFLERYNPRMFVFENVLGILTAKKGEPFADLKRLVEELGYKMDCKVQIASEHGVLQDRHRVIIVGWKDNQFKGYSYPILEKESMSYAVMKDLFSDLPLRKAGEGNLCGIVSYTKPLSEMQYLKESGIRGVLDFTTQHVARPTNANDRQIYKIAVDLWLKNKQRLNYAKLPIQLQTHNNKKAFLNRFNVVNPFGCCHTVVAHIAMDGHYYIYPTPNPTIDTVRSITVREAARLQSFPDDYFFEGSRTAVLRQIGNAVPVVLAYKIAEEIKKILL